MRVCLKFILAMMFTVVLVTGCENGPEESTRSAPGGVLNQLAPDFTLADMQGNQVTLSQFRGKVVLLNFWATWCPPCREEMPSMEQLHQRYKDQGLVMLAVNVEEDGYQAVSRFLEGKNYTFPILLDRENNVQNAYKVFRFPETFVIDKNGIIVEKLIGGRDWMSGKAYALVNFLMGG